jgi:hypothetical protein
MNLNAIAGPVVSAVNPWTPATLSLSSGSSTNPDGTQVAKFQVPPIPVSAQVQALSFRDIQQIEHLNLQGTRVAIYLNGKIDGLVRVQKKGGDLITIATGAHAGVYLVAMVLEQWGDWAKVATTLQNDKSVQYGN